MGAPPPPNLPAPSVVPAVDSVPTSPTATICGFGLPNPLPLPKIFIPIPPIPFPDLGLPKIKLPFSLSCDPAKPVDLAGSTPYGGGRAVTGLPDPDLNPQSVTA